MDIELSNEAVKQYQRLNEPDLSRITDAIDKLERDPPEGDIKELKGYPGVYRVRVGAYWVLYTVEETYIDVFRIARRGQAYKE